VVDVLDCGEADSTPYLVMERLEGMPLSERLGYDGALSIEQTLEWLLPIMGAVAHVHDAGIVHRDLKPSNIFLHRDLAGRTVPKLLDFGIAKIAGDADGSLTATGLAVGTPEYMAPEQASGAPVGPPADVWAMGVVLHRCLTGEGPFAATTPQAVLSRVMHERAPALASRLPAAPARFAAAVDRALSPEPSERYPHMREMARALTVTASGAGIRLPAAPDPLGLPEFGGWCEPGTTASLTREQRVEPAQGGRRGGAWIALALVAFAVAAFGLLVATRAPSSADEPEAATAPPEPAPPAFVASPARPADAGVVAEAEPEAQAEADAEPEVEAAPASHAPRAPAPARPSKPRRRRPRPARPSAPEPAPATVPEVRTQW
jgi:serine/threonine-protein kinase